uniref:Tubulin--tyrosine ligase-like protein 9 n=1 Tax=Calcidiscus leptoporus TaxID=127549 RepID=A0A7S0P1B5_9EUKA
MGAPSERKAQPSLLTAVIAIMFVALLTISSSSRLATSRSRFSPAYSLPPKPGMVVIQGVDPGFGETPALPTPGGVVASGSKGREAKKHPRVEIFEVPGKSREAARGVADLACPAMDMSAHMPGCQIKCNGAAPDRPLQSPCDTAVKACVDFVGCVVVRVSAAGVWGTLLAEGNETAAGAATSTVADRGHAGRARADASSAAAETRPAPLANAYWTIGKDYTANSSTRSGAAVANGSLTVGQHAVLELVPAWFKNRMKDLKNRSVTAARATTLTLNKTSEADIAKAIAQAENNSAVYEAGFANKEEKLPVGEWYEYEPPRTLLDYRLHADGTSVRKLRNDELGVFEFSKQAEPWKRKGCKRSFRVGMRGDMRGVMRPIFLGLGLCEATTNTSAVDVLWGRPWEEPAAFFRPKAIAAGMITNSIAGLPQQVGVKASLARLQLKCFQRFHFSPLHALPNNSPHCRFTKRAFAVSRDGSNTLKMAYKEFRVYNQQLLADSTEKLSHLIWIMKPRTGFNQIGIHMYSLPEADMETDEKTAAWLMQRVPEGEWVLQEYVMSPMTFQGHKFDLRIWCLVTSLDPLRMHLMGTGIPKVSTWTYSNEPQYVKNLCIHVLFPGTSECYFSKDKMARILKPYPQTTTDSYWYESMYPTGERFWKQQVWPTVEHRLAELLLLTRDAILHIDHQIKRKGLRYKRVFFLQPDFVFDSEGNGLMVEVNTNGYMIGNLHSMFFNLHNQQVAVTKLMGAGGYPMRTKYLPALKHRVHEFCNGWGCTHAMAREIYELVHEEMHASRGWYRMFPQQLRFRSDERRGWMSLLVETPQWERSLTPLDKLMLAWLDENWWPEHIRDENDTVVVLHTPVPR